MKQVAIGVIMALAALLMSGCKSTLGSLLADNISDVYIHRDSLFQVVVAQGTMPTNEEDSIRWKLEVVNASAQPVWIGNLISLAIRQNDAVISVGGLEPGIRSRYQFVRLTSGQSMLFEYAISKETFLRHHGDVVKGQSEIPNADHYVGSFIGLKCDIYHLNDEQVARFNSDTNSESGNVMLLFNDPILVSNLRSYSVNLSAGIGIDK